MAKFRRNKKLSVPSLLTYTYANMMFLFVLFFLLMTNIRKDTTKSQFYNRDTTQLTHLERKTLVTFISIQPAYSGKGSTIQINDSYATVDDVYNYIIKERASLSKEDKNKMIISLRIDKNTKMEIVNDVRQTLIKAGVTKVDYRL